MLNNSKFRILVDKLTCMQFCSCISCRIDKSMDDLVEKLETAYKASGGRKVNLITHSMGGLLVMCFISLHNEVPFSILAGKAYLKYISHYNFVRHNILYLCRYFPSMLTSGSLLHVLFKVILLFRVFLHRYLILVIILDKKPKNLTVTKQIHGYLVVYTAGVCNT